MLKKKQYLKTVKRPYPPLFASLVFSGLRDKINFKEFLPEPYSIVDFIFCDNYWYYSTLDIEKGTKIIFDHWMNPLNLANAKKVLERREKKLIDSTRSEFTSFQAAFEEYMPALVLVWFCDQPVASKVKELLSKKLPEGEVETLMNHLNIPLQDNFYKLEEYDLVTTKNIKNHVKEYAWINSRYGEENPYTLEEAKEKLSKINKSKFLKKWKEEKKNLKKTIAYSKKILGNDAAIIDLMQFIIYYRTHRTDIISKSLYLYIPQLKKLAKENGCSYTQLLYCTNDELLRKIPPQSVIQERINNFAFVMENTKLRIITGKERKAISEFLKEDIKKVKEFKGHIACKGLVQGKAKLIFRRSDYSKINESDILVTSMTTPDMVPILRKAAAFVTDEGGITCHAAIISRELKKPCIIGTKNATVILKDGDLVEVDANKGTVKILKKSS